MKRYISPFCLYPEVTLSNISENLDYLILVIVKQGRCNFDLLNSISRQRAMLSTEPIKIHVNYRESLKAKKF